MTDQPARVPAQASPSATAAYVRIYEEEQPRLVAYARSLTRNTWAAEDLVAEAHFRVWRRLSAGHEIDNVPAYLMTTVRHLASSVASATRETPRDPQIPEQASVRHVDDPAEQVSSTDLLVRVLGELPERWAQALWLADAEGQPLETVGRQIGAKQGATAVLLHRAREGMRQAFLRSQTEAPDDPACEVHWVRMPAYVRGNATPRQSERLLAHVDACDGCRGRLAVLTRANNRLPALVGPALLVFVVGGGTGKFLASLTAGSAGAASATGQGLLRTARAAGPKAKAALASGTAAAAAIAVVLALGVNDSPATVTSPGKVPVAQGPVAQGPLAQAPVTGPSSGAAEETPGVPPGRLSGIRIGVTGWRRSYPRMSGERRTPGIPGAIRAVRVVREVRTVGVLRALRRRRSSPHRGCRTRAPALWSPRRGVRSRSRLRNRSRRRRRRRNSSPSSQSPCSRSRSPSSRSRAPRGRSPRTGAECPNSP